MLQVYSHNTGGYTKNRPETPSFALLIIDMINDFDFNYGNMLLAHTELIVDPILKLKKQMKEKGFPIIYITIIMIYGRLTSIKSLINVKMKEMPH